MLDKDQADAASHGAGGDGGNREPHQRRSRDREGERCRGGHAEPGRHGAADQSDDDGAAAVALERHAIEIAELLHHAQIDRGDAGDGDDRQRQQTANPA